MNLKRDLLITDKSQIGNEILAYLTDHPKAQDSMEGILNWWMLERAIKFQEVQVKKSLAELVAKGLILEHTGLDSQTHYRINQRKYEEIKELYKN